MAKLLAAAMTCLASALWAVPALAQPVTITSGLGADTCEDPSAAHMSTWWLNTPSNFMFWGTYIGGANMGCPQPNLSAGYIASITDGADGLWDLAPLWVGPQAPCPDPGHSYNSYFSMNTSTAYTQGYNTGQNAYNEDVSLGMGSRVPVNDDLEAFDTSNSSCVAAAQAFVSGWSAFFVYAGLYGSVSGSALAAYAGSGPPPQHIWGGQWDGDSNVNDVTGLSYLWVDNQRIKQYAGPQTETKGGVTLTIDSDSVDAVLYEYPPS